MGKKLQAIRRAFFFQFLLILTGGWTLILLLLWTTYHLAFWRRIYPGVAIAGQPVGNLAVERAARILKSPTFPANLVLVYENQQWEVNLKEIGFDYDSAASAQKAYLVGRSGHLVKDLSAKINSWFRGVNLDWEYQIEQGLLEAEIETIAQALFVPQTEPSLTISGQQVKISLGERGRKLDKKRLFLLIDSRLKKVNFTPINLPLIFTSSQLTARQIENTRQRATRLLRKRLILTTKEKEWVLLGKELVSFLSFTNGFDQEKIASWVANLASTINRPPENAAFQFSGGKVVEFRPAKEGRRLEEKKTTRLISQSLSELEAGKETITLLLPTVKLSPAIKTGKVNTLGINQLVGRGLSYFRGSTPSRVHNIKLATSKLNGLLLAPGEIFSFNQSLGEISEATGFSKAYIIKEGRTVLGDGGGVCQVSTTLFRAALDAGLPIIERHPHAYRVSYYEQNSPPGLDATVFAPRIDLKFKNDTPAYLLIQSKIDTQNQILTFEFYGTHDGRTVSLSQPRIWDQQPPLPDLYQDEPTLPVGTIKQVDWKAWGAKVAFDYQVKRGDKVLQERTFYSLYHPWQAVFLRGTAPTPGVLPY